MLGMACGLTYGRHIVSVNRKSPEILCQLLERSAGHLKAETNGQLLQLWTDFGDKVDALFGDITAAADVEFFEIFALLSQDIHLFVSDSL